jgi:hypothetical protein
MKHFLLLLGIIALLAGGSVCRSAVVYSGVQNIVIPTTFDGVYVDIDDGAMSTGPFSGWDINVFFGGVGIGASGAFEPARTGAGVLDPVIRLGVSDEIGSGLWYAGAVETGSSDHLGAAGNFQDGEEGYLGFKFTRNDSNGPYYGWMRMTLTANTAGAVIHDWAWENSGALILAGVTSSGPSVVPEPGRAMLLVIGAGGAAVVSRRRRSLTQP